MQTPAMHARSVSETVHRRPGFLELVGLTVDKQDPPHATEEAYALKTLGGLLQNIKSTSAVLSWLSEYREHERALIHSISLMDYSTAATIVRACCDTLRKTENNRSSSKQLAFAERITNLVKQALGQLVQDGRLDDVCVLVRVLPLLNAQDEGIEVISSYVQHVLHERVSENFTGSSVLEKISVKLSHALKLVITCCHSMKDDFDDVSIRAFVRNSCSQVAQLISQTVVGLVRVSEAEKIDESNIGEFVMIGRACVVFWRELGVELRTLVPLSELDLCSYQDSSRELLLVYTSAEVRLLRLHYVNAFTEQSKDGSVSFLYDVFYVFKRSFQRTCTSTSSQAVIRILSEAASILEDMRLTIQRCPAENLRESLNLDSPDLGMQLLINNRIEEWMNRPDVSRRNSIGLRCETVSTLGATLLSDARCEIQSCAPNRDEFENLNQCFLGVEAAIANFTKFSTETAATVAQDFVETMKPAFHELTLSGFVLSDTQFEKIDQNGSWVDAVLLSCGQLFKCCQHRFSCASEAWVSKLFDSVIKRTAMVLELNMSNHLRFNQLGALLFERQIRALVVGLSYVAQQPCTRNEFSKILSACRILSLDDASDVVDYLDASSGKILELSMNEVHEVLRLRVDFSEHAIQKTLGNLFLVN